MAKLSEGKWNSDWYVQTGKMFVPGNIVSEVDHDKSLKDSGNEYREPVETNYGYVTYYSTDYYSTAAFQGWSGTFTS